MRRIGDITGQKFGRWMALNLIKKRIRGSIAWKCRCDCGNIAPMPATQLTSGRSKSCGCSTKKDITGQRFGRLVVIKLTNKRSSGGIVWRCLCDCGKIVLVLGTHLRIGNTKSCGCYKKECTAANGRKTVKNITGKRFFRLVAIKPTDRRRKRGVVWECQCDCGRTTLAGVSNLLSGNRKSCGCLQFAIQFARGTNMNPIDVPFEITNLMKARGKLKKVIKQAS